MSGVARWEVGRSGRGRGCIPRIGPFLFLFGVGELAFSFLIPFFYCLFEIFLCVYMTCVYMTCVYACVCSV